jgi:hypothetical protein
MVVVENITVATAKLTEWVGQRLRYRHRPGKNSPVGIGEVLTVLECGDEDDDGDHHWQVRQDKGRDRSDRNSRT